MHIGVLAIDFHLSGCRSLKEKRQRLRRLRDKFGRIANLAVCESRHQDSLRRAVWSVLAVAADAKVVEQALAEVEQWVVSTLDATVVGTTSIVYPADVERRPATHLAGLDTTSS